MDLHYNIKLITEKEYNRLLEIQNKHPILTFQNKGYGTINKSKLTNKEKDAIKEIEDILRSAISTFSGFQNFRLRSDRSILVRFQRHYNEHFTGVDYIPLIDLFKFNQNAFQNN